HAADRAGAERRTSRRGLLRRARHRHDHPGLRHPGGQAVPRQPLDHPGQPPSARDRRARAGDRPPEPGHRRAGLRAADPADPSHRPARRGPGRAAPGGPGARGGPAGAGGAHHPAGAGGPLVTAPVEAAPRVAPGARADVGLVNWLFARASGLVTGTNPPNLFLTLGRHRRLFRGWLRCAGHLMPGGRIDRRTTELVILRVAHLSGCEYELEHHRHLARRARITEDEVERVLTDPTAAAWTPRERAVLAAVDELHATGDLADGTWSAV